MLRVLGAAEMLPIPPGLSDEDLVEDGMIPGIPAIEPHGPYDRDPAFFPTFEDREGDVWEDEKGVWSELAPEALLLTVPRLWEPYNDWSLGKHDLTDRDLRKRSSLYCDAIVTLTGASRRASERARSEDKDAAEPPGVEL